MRMRPTLRFVPLPIAILLSTGLLAQGYTTELISHTTLDMITGDIDNDGDLDVISGGIRNLVWNENQGDGTFVQHVISLDTQEAQTIVMVDLDTDGHQDLVVADMAGNRIQYYRNNGDETFDRTALHSNSGGTSGVAIGDLDGDGDLDLACTAFTQNKVYWLRNEGGFQFTPVDVATGLTGASHVVVNDYDGDGDVDLAVTVQTAGAARFFRNNGTGAFTNELLANMNTPRAIINDDVDQDGDMDILYSGGGGTGWFENTGTAFTQRSVFTYTGSRGVGAGDVNGDGYKDLLVCDYEEDDLIWRGYSAVGQFMGGGAVLDSDFDYISLAVAADLDGDGDLDVAAGSSFDLRVYINNGSAQFTTRRLNRYLGDARGATHGDFDGDGDVDMMAAGSLHMNWYQNDGTGKLTAYILRENNLARITVSTGMSIKTADMDGDGDDDAVFSERGGNRVSWIENLGGGLFSKRLVSNLTDAYSCQPVDFDDDGDMDVVASNLNSGLLYWYENNGSESFTQRSINLGYRTPFEARPCDYDNDGDMDVVTACYSSLDVMGKVVLSRNEGDGTFDVIEIDQTAPNATSVFWVDFDNDGDMDILSATANNNCLNLYRSTGGTFPSFVEEILISGVDYPTKVIAADFDNDGDIDLASTVFDDRLTCWYENDGTDEFTTYRLARNVVNPQSIGFGDIDGDGTLEIYATCSETEAVHLYRREGINNTPVVGPTPAACHDLFISELVHQPGDVALALEIYNPRSVPVDLSDYALRFYPNGTHRYDASILVGIIPPHGTHVVVAPNFVTNIDDHADQITDIWFAGSDAIVLVNQGRPIDIIGKVGEYFEDLDYWFSNGVGTFNTVLVRKPTIDHGDADGTDEFLPDVEWIEYPVNDYSHLGSHDAPCGSVCTPTVSIAPSATEVCAGGTVAFTASLTDGGAVPSYQWYVNGSPSGTASTFTTPALSNDAVIACAVTSNAACAPDAAVLSGSVEVFVVPTPAPVAAITGSSLSASPVPNAIYQWYFDGGVIPGATGSTHTATQAGAYTVTSIVGDCESSPSNAVVYDINTAIGLSDETVFSVFPNPTDGPLSVRSNGRVERVQVWNALGACLQDTNLPNLDLSGLAAGAYNVRATVNGQQHQRTIIIR